MPVPHPGYAVKSFLLGAYRPVLMMTACHHASNHLLLLGLPGMLSLVEEEKRCLMISKGSLHYDIVHEKP